MRRITLVLSAPMVLAAFSTHAQSTAENPTTPPQETLPPLVITATREPTELDNIAAGVTIIDRATIDQRGYTTLVDALGAVPGLHIVQSGTPGSPASLFVRGGDSNQVLVLRDGVPINNPSDPNGAYDFGTARLEDIERIEIVRGPMSGAYGTGAIMGVINLISRQGDGSPHGSAEFERQSGPGVGARANYGGRTGILDYSLSLDGTSNAGYDPTPQRLGGIYNSTSEPYASGAATINLGINPDPDTRLGFFLRGSQTDVHFNDNGYPIYDSALGQAHTDSVFGRLSATTRIADIWQTTLSGAIDQSDRHYTNPLDPNDPNMAFENSYYHARRWDTQWNNSVSLPDLDVLTANSITFGFERIEDSANTRVNNSSGGFAYQDSVRAGETTNAGWVGAQTTLAKRLVLSAQARQDAVGQFGSVATWRVGAVLNVPEIYSHLHASYGTGFLAPSLFQLYGIDSYGYQGNPGLRPETSRGSEFGWQVDLPAAGQPDFISLAATWFDSRVNNLIVTQYSATGSTPVNVNNSHLYGIETTLSVRPGAWLQLDANYTYTIARDVTDQSALLRRPQSQAAIDLRITPLPGLTIAPELQMIGSFSDYLVDSTGNANNVGIAPGATLLNVAVTYEITPRVSLYLRGQNLTNAPFEPANGYQIPGIWVTTGLRLIL